LSKDGSLAQSVEQLAVNQFVGGSSPSSPATQAAENICGFFYCCFEAESVLYCRYGKRDRNIQSRI
jgi:hypothetical protein